MGAQLRAYVGAAKEMQASDALGKNLSGNCGRHRLAAAGRRCLLPDFF